MELEETSYIILGNPFRCLGLPPEEKADLDALLAAFPRAGEVVGETVDFRLERTADATFLEGGGARWDLTGTTDPLSSHAEYRLIDEALRRAQGFWILHAGAVAVSGGEGGTCLLIGESGAGKTSLTLWLWTGGLRLGTDDLCPIRHGSLAPEVFPRALHMDAEYSPRLMEKMPPRPPGYPRDYYPFPDTKTDTPLPGITHLIALKRGPRPEGEVEPLSQAEAVNILLGAAIRTPGFDFGQAWEDMRRLAAGCRAYRLSASTPEGAGERALQLLGF